MTDASGNTVELKGLQPDGTIGEDEPEAAAEDVADEVAEDVADDVAESDEAEDDTRD